MKLKFLITIASLLSAYTFCFGQVRSSVGLNIGINQPLSSGYKTGYGFGLQFNIRLSDQFALVPVLGYEQVRSKEDYSMLINNIRYSKPGGDILYIGPSLKYYATTRLFARAGALSYIIVGREDILSSFYPTLAVGYTLPAGKRNNLELSLQTDVIRMRDSPNYWQTIAGLKVAYNFNFR